MHHHRFRVPKDKNYLGTPAASTLDMFCTFFGGLQCYYCWYGEIEIPHVSQWQKCTWFDCPQWKRRALFTKFSWRSLLMWYISFPQNTYLDDEYQIGSVTICRTNKNEFLMYKMHHILYYYIHSAMTLNPCSNSNRICLLVFRVKT